MQVSRQVKVYIDYLPQGVSVHIHCCADRVNHSLVFSVQIRRPQWLPKAPEGYSEGLPKAISHELLDQLSALSPNILYGALRRPFFLCIVLI